MSVRHLKTAIPATRARDEATSERVKDSRARRGGRRGCGCAALCGARRLVAAVIPGHPGADQASIRSVA